MSYASVAAQNLPPDQPQADPGLLNTEIPLANDVADDFAKVNVVGADFKEHPSTVTSEKTVFVEPETPDPSTPSKKDKAKKRLHEAESEGIHFWGLAKHSLLRPGVAGGLIGIVNIGLISGVGYLYYTRPVLRRDTKAISSTVAASLAILGVETYAAEAYRKTPRGQEEERKAKQEGAVIYTYLSEQLLRPGVLGGLVGLVNVGILSTVGYLAYANWDKPRWDRRTVSGVSVVLLTLWGGEGYLAEQYRDKR